MTTVAELPNLILQSESIQANRATRLVTMTTTPDRFLRKLPVLHHREPTLQCRRRYRGRWREQMPCGRTKDSVIVPRAGVHLERRIEAQVVESRRDAVADGIDELKEENQRFWHRSTVRDISEVHERKYEFVSTGNEGERVGSC